MEGTMDIKTAKNAFLAIFTFELELHWNFQHKELKKECSLRPPYRE